MKSGFQSMQSNQRYKVLFSFLTLGFILFIFSNSMFTGPESGSQSRFVMNMINHLLASLKISYAIPELFIRKLGHFTEYFILGVLLTLTIYTYRIHGALSVFIKLFVLLLVPVFDEFIQLFTPGRGSSVADVLLDFCGGCVGMILCILLISLSRSGKGHKRRIHSRY